jgi:hypothetical protein
MRSYLASLASENSPTAYDEPGEETRGRPSSEPPARLLLPPSLLMDPKLSCLRWLRRKATRTSPPSALVTAKSDPYVAAVLVDLSGTDGRLGGLKRVTDLFSDQEIVGSALSFLAAFPNAGLDDGRWASMALWNQWGQLEAADHLRLVEKLIEQVPWDDQTLWMIGDGPLSTLADEPVNLETMESWVTSRDKLAQIWKLLEADGPRRGAGA